MRPSARRWLIVLALFVVTYGISTPLAAYGVFLPVLAETYGWSRPELIQCRKPSRVGAFARSR